jgi:hypothetical protein
MTQKTELVAEQPIAALSRYTDLFPGAHPALAIASILDGNTAAHLWTISSPGNEQIALLWDLH